MTRFALIPACLLIVTGCPIGPKYRPPVTQAPPVYKETPAQFKEAETEIWKVAEPSDAMLRGNWWEIFNDPELNALEEQLNIDNQNIKQFFENFMAARAIVREARAQLFPTATTSPTYSRTKSSGNLGRSFSPQTGTGSGFISTLYSFPVDVSWTADVFGKIRKTVHEQQYLAQLSAADLENERLIEQAALATFFFEIRGQDALQKVLNDTVEADKQA